MIQIKILSAILLLLTAINIGAAQHLEKQSIVKTDYLMYLPDGYEENSQKEWPLMIYLHGAGIQEASLNGLKQDFLPWQISNGKKFPFMVVSPVCNTGLWNIDILNFLLDDILSGFRVDEDKIYLTGHSMGGFGTWEWAFDNPQRFAAIAPVSGCSTEEDRARAWKLRNMPIWLFHGDNDEIVDIQCNIEIAQKLKEYGDKLKFTIYPKIGHETWEQTYLNNNLYKWLLEQDRKNNGPKPIALDEETYSNYFGQYVMDKDTITIFSDSGQLQMSMGKGRKRNLLAESKTVFSFEKNAFLGIVFTKKDSKIIGFDLLSDSNKSARKIK